MDHFYFLGIHVNPFGREYLAEKLYSRLLKDIFLQLCIESMLAEPSQYVVHMLLMHGLILRIN